MNKKCKICGEWNKYPKLIEPCYPGRQHEWIPFDGPTRNDMDEVKFLAGALLRIADETDSEKMREIARRVLNNTGWDYFRVKNPDLETLEAEIIE